MQHSWEYCGTCNCWAVVCSNCQNITCNGGIGEGCADQCKSANEEVSLNIKDYLNRDPPENFLYIHPFWNLQDEKSEEHMRLALSSVFEMWKKSPRLNLCQLFHSCRYVYKNMANIEDGEFLKIMTESRKETGK